MVSVVQCFRVSSRDIYGYTVVGARESCVGPYVLYIRALRKHQASKQHSTASVKLEIGAQITCLGGLNPVTLHNWARMIVKGLYNSFIEDRQYGPRYTRERIISNNI